MKANLSIGENVYNTIVQHIVSSLEKPAEGAEIKM